MKETALITASVIAGLTLGAAIMVGAILTRPAPAVEAPKPLPKLEDRYKPPAQLPDWFLGAEDKARYKWLLEPKPTPKPPERIRPRPYHWHEV